MSEQKPWQPSTIQVETAAMAFRAQQMRLWNLVEESATVGRCWNQTPAWLRCEYRQAAAAMLTAAHSHTPESLASKHAPAIKQLGDKAAEAEEKHVKELLGKETRS